MASLGDLKPVLKEIGVREFVKRVYTETMGDHVFVYASALSYAWLFAFFPMLIFLVSLLPFLPAETRSAGQHLIYEAIERNFPKETADWILTQTKLKTVLETTLENRRGALLSLSLLIALYAASNGISAIMTALDRAYDLDKGRPFYRSKPLSLLITCVLTVLVLIVMVLIPIGTFAHNWIVANGFTIPYTDIQLNRWMVYGFDFLRYLIGLTAGFLILSIIYNFCPSVKMRWRLISPGAVFCFGAWVAIGLIVKVYLSATGGTAYATTFGPAAGLAMLLLMFYLYGVVLLIGAEINSEIDYCRLRVEPGTRDLRPAQRALELRLKNRSPEPELTPASSENH